MNLSQRDKNLMWHPFTQEQTAQLPIAVKKAQGCYLYDENDKSYLDLISSWWVNLHGHAHPQIAKAIYEQALNLEHVMFAGFTHEPAVKLCESLQALLPATLKRFFFSDNGSTSTESALKMAYQYWWNRGEADRKIFLSLDGGYHGDTFGAMSVSATSGYHAAFAEFFFSILTVPFPATWQDDRDVVEKEHQALAVLKKHLQENGSKIAAIILEPIVQGASGMRMCRPQFVKQVVDLVRETGILVIFDEVMTGFGRTGSYFAFEQIEVIPDFLCLSKGLTGGFLPLALTITTEDIYTAFLSEHYSKAFAHGHSYTANPLGCAAALASLELLLRPETKAAFNMINSAHQKGLALLKASCKQIKNIRLHGTIAAFEVTGDYDFNLNAVLKTHFLEQGLLIRPLGNTIYLLPPYAITETELAEAYEKMQRVISALIPCSSVSKSCLDRVF